MVKKDEKDDDPVGALLTEEEKLQQREEEIKQKLEKIKPSPKTEQRETKKQKGEEVAMETPQDRFRKILQDNGYKVGVESLTEVFFRGDTNSPEWLDYALNLGHIPAKNREIIISTYYGKTLEELGIKIEASSIKPKDKDKKESDSTSKDNAEFDPSKMADDELKDYMKQQKYEAALEMLETKKEESRARREELEERRKAKNNPQPTTMMMRQVQRPVIINGAPVTNKDGTILYETVQEPIPNGHGGGTDLTGIAAIIAALSPKINSSGESPELLKAIEKQNQKIEELQKSAEIQRKEDEIKRLNEKIEKQTEESKKELEKKEESFKERLDRLEAERIRDLTELKERFQETIAHRKELDEIVGGQAAQHKKEMDEIKKRLDHAQTSIERTVVSKGTETADKVMGKVGDIAESVIKPMANVMKDHYTTVIDIQRKNMGLPPSKDSIPPVADEELAQFAKG